MRLEFLARSYSHERAAALSEHFGSAIRAYPRLKYPWTLLFENSASRYVHPSEDAVLNAMARLGGHNSRHSDEATQIVGKQEQPQLAEKNEGYWRARRDSNSRPVAPEATALSS